MSAESLTERPADLPVIPRGGPPLLVVLSGFSGAGKDSVRDLLMAWRLPLHFVVTATTRAPRNGEVEGRDYRFVSDEAFDRLEEDDGLIEKAVVYGQRKGVPRSELEEPLAAGEDVLARVDVQGAATLRRLYPEALLIFIAPPSMEEMRRRLEERGSEPEEERRARIAAAAEEIEASKSFDHIVVNETGALETTARRVIEIIAAEKQRRLSAAKHQEGQDG
jgi:guanylate kinase